MAEQNEAARWEHWRVEGSPPVLTTVLGNLDATLPSGWSRTSVGGETEVSASSRGTVRHYQLAMDEQRGTWSVPIEHRYGSELRAGYVTRQLPPGTTPGARFFFPLSDLTNFLDNCVRPAAAQAGATLRIPTVAERFFAELPWEVREALTAFEGGARKRLPLTRAESEAWQAFVIAAKKSSGAADYGWLGEWLSERGWSENEADNLAKQFFDQLELLSRYHDTLVIA